MDKAYAHVRCYASETIVAVDLLVMFFMFVLKPQDLMIQHGHCLQLLKWIMDIMFAGDSGLKHLNNLDTLVDKHHTLFLELFWHCIGNTKIASDVSFPGRGGTVYDFCELFQT